jgi:hypothetical protein
LAFLVAIGAGTVLLMLPVSRAGDGSAPSLTAPFTSTSAVCVTGLIVEDTPLYWSRFGQALKSESGSQNIDCVDSGRLVGGADFQDFRVGPCGERLDHVANPFGVERVEGGFCHAVGYHLREQGPK